MTYEQLIESLARDQGIADSDFITYADWVALSGAYAKSYPSDALEGLFKDTTNISAAYTQIIKRMIHTPWPRTLEEIGFYFVLSIIDEIRADVQEKLNAYWADYEVQHFH